MVVVVGGYIRFFFVKSFEKKMWAWVWFQAAKLLLTYFIVRLILEFVRVVDEVVRLVSKIM
jgi:hypothetical protein